MSKASPTAGFSLKDQLFNRERVEYLANLFAESLDEFEAEAFVRQTMRRLNRLELKQRIVHIAETLEKFLSSDFTVAAKQITTALPPPLDPHRNDDDFGDFIFAPLGEFVVRTGVDKKHLALSLRTLKALTMRFSMEDAIRTFINQHPDRTMKELEKWSRDSNYHVRRLASEGTRPRLPWSKRLDIDPAGAIGLLDNLHSDPTRYVTRSVANHLNDISKSDPGSVLETLKRWRAAERQEEKELAWMEKHALRTLVKQGDRDALRFLGFCENPSIQISGFSLARNKVSPGEAIEIEFQIQSLRDESLLIDYVIDFVKSNGMLAPKVHKLKQLQIKKGERVTVRKRHKLHAAATTYTLYPGTHHVTLQINGGAYGTQSFDLVREQFTP